MDNYENILGYTVERKKVKNINLIIKQDGTVNISAPFGLDKYYIENFINSKKNFIEKHVQNAKKYATLKENLDNYKNNSYISYLGVKYPLKIYISDINKLKFEQNIVKVYIKEYIEKDVKDMIYRWYYNNAISLFNKRFEYYKNLMGENENIRLIIKPIKGKWGFCVPKKREIALNIELMKKSVEELDSVIVHEISHLRYPNHSKDFYNYIDIYFKDYKKINKKLNYNI